MISYLMQKWAYSKKFEANETGYLYRKRPGAPGYQLSEEEHRNVMADFKRANWRWFLRTLLAIFGALAILVVLILAKALLLDDPPESLLRVATYLVFTPLMLFLIVDFFRAQHRYCRNCHWRSPARLPGARLEGGSGRDRAKTKLACTYCVERVPCRPLLAGSASTAGYATDGVDFRGGVRAGLPSIGVVGVVEVQARLI